MELLREKHSQLVLGATAGCPEKGKKKDGFARRQGDRSGGEYPQNKLESRGKEREQD